MNLNKTRTVDWRGKSKLQWQVVHFTSLILVGVEETVITITSVMLQRKAHFLHDRTVGYKSVKNEYGPHIFALF